MGSARSIFLVCALAAVCCGCGWGARAAFVDADAEFDRCVLLRRNGRHAKAAAAFAQFAAKFEHDRRADYAQYLSGEEYRAAGQDEAAFEAYSKLFAAFRHSAYLSKANERCLEMAKGLLARGDSRGVRFLEQVTYRSPYGEQSARAHMMLGNHYYAQGRFADAKVSFDAIMNEHRGSRLAAKAALGAALCEYRQIDRPARNMAHAAAARERFRKLRTAPLSADEMSLVDKYLAEVIDLIAERQLLMARFHLKQGELAPALVYLRDIIENCRTSRYSRTAAELVLYIHERHMERK